MSRKIKFSVFLIQTLLSLLCAIIVISWSIPYLDQYKYLRSQSYSNIYEYSNNDEIPNSYYLLNGVLQLHSNSGIKAEMLMQKSTEYNEISPFSEVTQLADNQIAVSANLLSAENIEVGDYISFYNPLHDTNEEYVVACEVDANYGLLSDTLDKRYGVIVFAEDSEIVLNNKLNSVVYADSSFSASQNQLLIEELYSKKDLLSDCRKQSVISLLILIAVCLIINLIAFSLFVILSSDRLKKLVIFGASCATISRFIRSNYLAVSFASSVLVYVIIALFLFFAIGDFTFSLIVLVCNYIGIAILSFVARKMVTRRKS